MQFKQNHLVDISEKIFDSFKKTYDKNLLFKAIWVANDIILENWYAGIEDPEININAYAEALKFLSNKKLVITESSIDINNNNTISRKTINIFRNKNVPYTPCIIAKDGTPFRYYYIVDYSNETISISNTNKIIKNYSKKEIQEKFIQKNEDSSVIKCWTYWIHK